MEKKNKYAVIKNPKLSELVERFNKETLEEKHDKFIGVLIEAIKDLKLEDLDWYWFAHVNEKYPRQMFNLFIQFMFFLIDNNEFKDDKNVNEIQQNRGNLMRFNFPMDRGRIASGDYSIVYHYPKGFDNITPFSFVSYPSAEDRYSARGIIIDGIDYKTNYILSNYLAKKRKDNDRLAVIVMATIFKNKPGLMPEDFNDQTFEEDLKTANRLADEDSKIYDPRSVYTYCYSVINFYLFIQDILGEELCNENFKKYNEAVLSYQYIASKLHDGFEVIKHNKFDKVPKSDKWIIDKNDECKDRERIACIDFTLVTDKEWRKIVKEYYWTTINQNYRNENKRMKHMFDFVNLVAERHKGTTIEVADIIQYKKNVLDADKTSSYTEKCLSMAKKLILFLKSKGLVKFGEHMFTYFDLYDERKKAYTEAYTKDEIITLLDKYQQDYKTCTNKIKKQRLLLEYYIVMLMSLTEMRKASILALRTDSLREVLKAGKNEYVVHVPSKTTDGEDDTYPITNKVANVIKEVLKQTESDRKEATPAYKEKLFICRRDIKRNIAAMSERTMDSHLRQACSEAGIKYKPFAAIRNYYQNEVSEFLDRKGLSHTLIPALAKHGIDIHYTHYVPIDIKRLCVSLYAIDIGDITLRGQIQEKGTENRVYRNCGSCNQKHCSISNNYDCLMCENFVTTPDNISWFKEEIKRIDEQIAKQTIVHEVEFLQSKKKLLVSYYAKLVEFKGEMINGINW